MTYSVTVKAFGHVSTHRFEANSPDEARQKALDRLGLDVRVEIVTPKDAR
jgi:hypothetical protein